MLVIKIIHQDYQQKKKMVPKMNFHYEFAVNVFHNQKVN